MPATGGHPSFRFGGARTATLVTVRGSRGFTLVELLIVVAILGVLLSMAMVGYRHARVQGGEATAVATLGTINRGQVAFAQVCGNERFAPSLSSLGVPVPGSGQPFLSPDLTQADEIVKNGYLIRMAGTELPEAPPTCIGALPVAGYQVTADPTTPGVTGVRRFGTNGDRVIFQDDATFAGNMPEEGAPSHGTEIR
jgi:prepilin-type N-terminal cleavage/methylation domain-containing protein